ncbi:L,D-transpeptidase family protein [Amaricoccus sp.]|uniref:L,D-transpeptidase family protein n=1 Tax=Amaricoccus sp. TaxID=1872485 RepID=UPI0026052BA9|nr:L,D-transpeptidase family protein [Amaricoccus sp.]HRO11752.1 L,D-transpeptidase family protein [Amaricoccus sp.]
MNERTWLLGEAELPLDDDDLAVERKLWTRRSALALTAGFLALGSVPARASYVPTLAPRANHIVVSKSKRVLALMSGAETLKRYKVHLGFTPRGHKQQSGDGRTPEGRYYIDRRNPRSEFYLSLGVSYPNALDVARARALGVKPGGDIFIHGGPRRTADRRKTDWTAGCIAVSDAEMEEIWSMVPTGIPITILA